MKKRRLWLFSFFMVFSFLLGKNVLAESVTIGSSSQWIDTAKEWTKIMEEDGNWYYSNSGNRTYWEDARNASERTSNCALMVVHSLQRFGVFGKNNKIWSGDDHQLVYRPASTENVLKAIANIYTYSGVSEGSIDLEPGDILCFSGHMNIYIGMNDKDVRQYLDAGRGTNTTHETGGIWKSFLRTTNTLGKPVYGIIRLKYNETVDIDIDKGTTSENSGGDGSTIDPGVNFPIITNGDFDCDTVFLNKDGSEKEIKKILDGLFILIQVVAPVVAIALTIMDFIKTLANGDVAKKAIVRTLKRILIASLIVFLPFLLDLLFHLFGLYDLSSCNIGR